MTDTETKLAELRAARAALAEASARRLEPTPDELLALEERSLKEDTALDAAQVQHGARAVRMVRTDAGELTSESAEELVKASLIYPSKVELDKLLREVPGCLTTLASVCVELAGFRSKDIQKK